MTGISFQESPVEETKFKGRRLWVKRDDRIHPYFNGNKARKFKLYIEKDLCPYNRIVSYGGHQSNAMYSLAALAKLKGLGFDYYVKPLPSFLKSQPAGNLRYALEMGMNMIEVKNYHEYIEQLSKHIDSQSDQLIIRQGGAEPFAEPGLKELAEEINHFAERQGIEDLAVFIPSGTGTTALYVSKHLRHKVYTTPNVGTKDYLYKQFGQLEIDPSFYPSVLETEQKYVYGKLYPEYYQIWQSVTEETGIEFELLYDPKTFIVMEAFMHQYKGEIMYVHSGGTVGNETMLNRYKRHFKNSREFLSLHL
jgi:1-aminocyclopropane-1-carboxylate deaminase/D-cysteine desulfhydrase-like pyridoxal-dependent ACC family enzyme